MWQLILCPYYSQNKNRQIKRVRWQIRTLSSVYIFTVKEVWSFIDQTKNKSSNKIIIPSLCGFCQAQFI